MSDNSNKSTTTQSSNGVSAGNHNTFLEWFESVQPKPELLVNGDFQCLKLIMISPRRESFRPPLMSSERYFVSLQSFDQKT
ncbi:hypothetical protein V5J35_000210 [Endozoicomonas sp. NE40]|uniref:Uncharacterized protein n=1 Tax=Endozoicomonas lisbonensis TaxID=3120522 RepID=A0ABV2SB80_9GAMM